MAESISRSMPAQKAFPAPVTITTRACPRSISSRAVCSSAIMVAEMALRLSGRFSVMVATCRLASRMSVEYMVSSLLSVHEWSMRIFCANFVGHFEHFRETRGIDAGIGPGFAQCHKDVLRGDVSHQIVSRKRASAKSGERAVKAAAAGFESGEDFFFGVFRAAVKMNAQLDSRDVIFHLAVEVADELRGGGADSVGERNSANADVFKPLERIGDEFRAPGLVVGIAKGHRNVDDEATLSRARFLF